MQDNNDIADNGVRKDVYEIRVRGHIAEEWSDWFDGMSITHLPGGESVLRGELTDQAALHGVLTRIRDMGLPLLQVVPGPSGEGDERLRRKTDADGTAEVG